MAPDEPSETSAAGPDAPAEEPGVFGNLPRTRPGARSPRRGEAAAAAPASERPAPARTPPSSAGSGTEPESAREHTAGKVPDPTGTGQAGGGIEDVAWAGIAAAAEAATIGVRLATRALEAARDTVDRR